MFFQSLTLSTIRIYCPETAKVESEVSDPEGGPPVLAMVQRAGAGRVAYHQGRFSSTRADPSSKAYWAALGSSNRSSCQDGKKSVPGRNTMLTSWSCSYPRRRCPTAAGNHLPTISPPCHLRL